MSRIPLNKSSLQKETARLRSYRKYLPSLELKRKQIMAERNKARTLLREMEAEHARQEGALTAFLPMLAENGHWLEGVTRVMAADFGQENIVGTWLPVLKRVEFETRPLSPLTTPHWLDAAAESLRVMVLGRWRLRIQRERMELLEEALRKTTQRVNLFDKVLIPRTQANIKKIKIFLSDLERAEVVRAKIAKGKHEAEEATA